jgi:hypothetical protein
VRVRAVVAGLGDAGFARALFALEQIAEAAIKNAALVAPGICQSWRHESHRSAARAELGKVPPAWDFEISPSVVPGNRYRSAKGTRRISRSQAGNLPVLDFLIFSIAVSDLLLR